MAFKPPMVKTKQGLVLVTNLLFCVLADIKINFDRDGKNLPFFLYTIREMKKSRSSFSSSCPRSWGELIALSASGEWV